MKISEHVTPGTLSWMQVGKGSFFLIAGLLVGFLGMTRAFGVQPSPAVSQERYVSLVSTVYGEGESLVRIKDYLAALGQRDYGAFLIQTAERYAKSSDRLKQRQADMLRQLAEALRQYEQGVEVPAVVQPSTVPVETRPTVTTESVANVLTAVMGLIRVQQGDSARLRTEPRTSAPTLIQLASGTKVEIVDVVDGQEVERNEKRWYKVRSGQVTGYVYFPLIAPAH